MPAVNHPHPELARLLESATPLATAYLSNMTALLIRAYELGISVGVKRGLDQGARMLRDNMEYE